MGKKKLLEAPLGEPLADVSLRRRNTTRVPLGLGAAGSCGTPLGDRFRCAIALRRGGVTPDGARRSLRGTSGLPELLWLAPAPEGGRKDTVWTTETADFPRPPDELLDEPLAAASVHIMPRPPLLGSV